MDVGGTKKNNKLVERDYTRDPHDHDNHNGLHKKRKFTKSIGRAENTTKTNGIIQYDTEKNAK